MSVPGKQARKAEIRKAEIRKPELQKLFTREQLKEKLEQTLTYARLVLSGKPLITVEHDGQGGLSLTEGYFGSKTSVTGLRYEDLPDALAHRLISEDAALEAFRYMVKNKIMIPANENQ